MRRVRFLYLSIPVLLCLFSGISSACIGEVAGHVHFNVSLGSRQTIQIQIFNSCNSTTINFTSVVTLDPLANAQTPNITVHPKHGTLLPDQGTPIYLTVSMPPNAIVNTTWSGGAAVFESINVPGPNGTVSQGGVGVQKILSATALPAQSHTINILYAIIAAAVILVLTRVSITLRNMGLAKKAERELKELEDFVLKKKK